jgi:hypothetical protein
VGLTYPKPEVQNLPIVIIMTDDEIFWTLDVASRFGGSFFAELAKAARFADPKNKKRVLEAFPEIAATYGPGTNFYRMYSF